jgi:hypothetical protein
MTTKSLAYSIQKYLQEKTGATIARSHVYELIAAAFGFNSRAAMASAFVLVEKSLSVRWPSEHEAGVLNRAFALGYSNATAVGVARWLPSFLELNQVGVVKLSQLLSYLRCAETLSSEFPAEDEAFDDEEDWLESVEDDELLMTGLVTSSLLQDELQRAAQHGKKDAIEISNWLHLLRKRPHPHEEATAHV